MNDKTNLVKLQEMLMDEMNRITKIDLNDGMYKREIERSKALSGNALNYIKSMQTSLKIKEYSDKTQYSLNQINKELGNIDDN